MTICARRDDYENITGSNVFPKQFCITRWVESKDVADRAIEIWSNIDKVTTYWGKFVPSKQPKCKSCDILKVTVKDHFMVVKLEVFSYIAGIVEPYLAAYQTDKSMVPFMYADLMELVKHLLKPFNNPVLLETANLELILRKLMSIK